METVRLTTAQAIVRWLLNQYIVIDGEELPIFAGAFGIFGHGNVTCLAEALEPVQDRLPMWRGHNEQSMALAAVACTAAMTPPSKWRVPPISTGLISTGIAIEA